MPVKKRILIVDDDNEITNMFSDFLRPRGFIVESVNNGEDALARALVFKPNLIILDVMMPKINGFDVLDILKNTPKSSNIPIMILSSLNSKEDVDKAKRLGAEAYLEKSTADLEIIFSKIKELLVKT